MFTLMFFFSLVLSYEQLPRNFFEKDKSKVN